MGDFQGPTVNFPGDKDLNPRPPGLMARWPGVRKDCERKSHDLYMNQLQFSLVDDDQKRYATVCRFFFLECLLKIARGVLQVSADIQSFFFFLLEEQLRQGPRSYMHQLCIGVKRFL